MNKTQYQHTGNNNRPAPVHKKPTKRYLYTADGTLNPNQGIILATETGFVLNGRWQAKLVNNGLILITRSGQQAKRCCEVPESITGTPHTIIELMTQPRETVEPKLIQGTNQRPRVPARRIVTGELLEPTDLICSEHNNQVRWQRYGKRGPEHTGEIPAWRPLRIPELPGTLFNLFTEASIDEQRMLAELCRRVAYRHKDESKANAFRKLYRELI